jgi:hypothetical protein
LDRRTRTQLLLGAAVALAVLIAVLTGTGILPSTPVPSSPVPSSRDAPLDKFGR